MIARICTYTAGKAPAYFVEWTNDDGKSARWYCETLAEAQAFARMSGPPPGIAMLPK